MIRPDATVSGSWVGPRTCIGEGANLNDSIAWGNGITKIADRSFIEIRDQFLIHDLGYDSSKPKASTTSVLLAALLLMITAPAFMIFALIRTIKKQPIFAVSRVVLNDSEKRSRLVKKLAGISGPASRWPELPYVLRREMALVGNRPLTLENVSALAGKEFHNWFKQPVGVFSKADSEGVDGNDPMNP